MVAADAGIPLLTRDRDFRAFAETARVKRYPANVVQGDSLKWIVFPLD